MAFAPIVPSFVVRGQSQKSSRMPPLHMMDPHEILTAATQTHHHFFMDSLHHTQDSLHHTQDSLSALISTMYSSNVAIEAGKSIAPFQSAAIKSTASGTSATPAEMTKEASEMVERLIKQSDNLVLDPRVISKYTTSFPGFQEIRGILPMATDNTDFDLVSAREMFQTSVMAHVASRLPMAAFVTVFVDFFIVNPGVEVYREDLQEDEMEVLLDTAKVNAVRVAVMAIVSVATIMVASWF